MNVITNTLGTACWGFKKDFNVPFIFHTFLYFTNLQTLHPKFAFYQIQSEILTKQQPLIELSVMKLNQNTKSSLIYIPEHILMLPLAYGGSHSPFC